MHATEPINQSDKQKTSLKNGGWHLLGTSAVYWLSTNAFFFLVKLGGFVLLVRFLVQVASFGWFIWLVFKFVKRNKLFTHKTHRSAYILALISAVLVASTFFNRTRANENTVQSPVILRACYEGTMNTSRLYFRQDGTYEDFNIGFLGHVSYACGEFERKNDTLYLTKSRGDLKLLGSTFLLRNKGLYAIEDDSLRHTPYYLGYCKGLN